MITIGYYDEYPEQAFLYVGTAKDVVNKAKEIEGYILDGIMLPDVYDEVDSMFGGAMGLVSSLNSDNKAKK